MKLIPHVFATLLLFISCQSISQTQNYRLLDETQQDRLLEAEFLLQRYHLRSNEADLQKAEKKIIELQRSPANKINTAFFNETELLRLKWQLLQQSGRVQNLVALQRNLEKLGATARQLENYYILHSRLALQDGRGKDPVRAAELLGQGLLYSLKPRLLYLDLSTLYLQSGNFMQALNHLEKGLTQLPKEWQQLYGSLKEYLQTKVREGPQAPHPVGNPLGPEEPKGLPTEKISQAEYLSGLDSSPIHLNQALQMLQFQLPQNLLKQDAWYWLRQFPFTPRPPLRGALRTEGQQWTYLQEQILLPAKVNASRRAKDTQPVSLFVRKVAAYLLWYALYSLSNDGSLQQNRAAGLLQTGEPSPLRDVALESPYYSPIIHILESEIMELLGSKIFAPTQGLSTLAWDEMLQRWLQYAEYAYGMALP